MMRRANTPERDQSPPRSIMMCLLTDELLMQQVLMSYRYQRRPQACRDADLRLNVVAE